MKKALEIFGNPNTKVPQSLMGGNGLVVSGHTLAVGPGIISYGTVDYNNLNTNGGVLEDQIKDLKKELAELKEKVKKL